MKILQYFFLWYYAYAAYVTGKGANLGCWACVNTLTFPSLLWNLRPRNTIKVLLCVERPEISSSDAFWNDHTAQLCNRSLL